MESFLHDVRYDFRMLRKSPAFTFVAIITLALGIGANTAIFSVVNAVLLRPLPYSDPGRLVVLRETKLPQFPEFSVSPGNFLDWQKQNTVFEQVAAVQDTSYNLVGNSDPERIRGARVTSNLFETLGVKPMIGRRFLPEEDETGRGGVVVLSQGLWQRHFGASPSILNTDLTLSGKRYTVVGVMPASFQYPDPRVDLWAPMAFEAEERLSHGAHYLDCIGRLKTGASLQLARAEMSTIAGRLAQQYARTNVGWDVRVSPMLEYLIADIKPALLVLQGAVGLVLLIACANVANLQLARASARQKEVAIRSALGAGRWRMTRQLLTENLLLALIGAALGLVLAWTGLQTLLALAPAGLPRINDVTIDGPALSFTLTISLLTGILFGLAPALHAARNQLNETLKEGGRSSGGGEGTHRIRAFLVVAEVALALVLLAGAGLLMKSFLRLQEVDPGFKMKDALVVSIKLPAVKYREDTQREQFFMGLIQKLQTLPRVQSVGATHVLPFDEDYILGFSIQGRPPYRPGEQPSTNYYSVSPDYFKAMGIPLVRGRTFTARDSRGAPRVAVINEMMARRHFPNEDPIGKKIHVTNGPETFREIVGIVGDVKHYGMDSETTVQTYEPFRQVPPSYMEVVIRYSGDPAPLGAAVREQVLSVDREQPVASIRRLDQIVHDSMVRRRFSMVLLAIFASVALVLAAVGIYGVMAYSVTQRTRELGIRLALGARQADVFRLVVLQGMALALMGLLTGLAGALALTRVISSLLFRVQATDPAVFAAIALLLGSVALLASYIPARRAMRVDPMVVLRYE